MSDSVNRHDNNNNTDQNKYYFNFTGGGELVFKKRPLNFEQEVVLTK